ncbi:hypothetical protein [Salinivibrio sp. YCSC6]|uniref:hypothetical protein n=1 Tax=Salinivibrio sp. YCSC6 TaxID=2003370 RepID=UPI000BBCE8B3|nr:hypothetical protein [Salinivibrio sp. YCSC6]PCE65530.1 hypothetical protein B6G00_16330 [Salinivibrio sp. YCSC6]QCF37437.1 hypothetical protein E8E00_14520 [Salinivibrio sp. YCSC6]
MTLSDLGDLGSFLSGVGTIFGVIVAIYGIKVWSKQLKNGKQLAYIWEAKALLSKFDNEFYFWHAFYKSHNQDIRRQGDKAYSDLKLSLNKLSDISFYLDVLSGESEEKWVRNVRGLKIMLDEHKHYLETTEFNHHDTKQIADQSLQIINIFKSKDVYIENLKCELNKLEGLFE